MLFGLIKIKQREMEFRQNSRVFFKLDKALNNISELALKLENTTLIEDKTLRRLFLFYWTAARVRIYFKIVEEYQLFHPKNINDKDYLEEDKYHIEALERHLLTYVSYDINPDFDTETGEGDGIAEYYRKFSGTKSRDYSELINSECFNTDLSENDMKILDKFFDISKKTFLGVIKNTQIIF